MDKWKTPLTVITILITMVSCSTRQKNKVKDLSGCPVVGTIVKVGDDSVVSCDQKLLTAKIDLPLSFLTEELQIVKLDNADEALVGEVKCVLSDNYILTWGRDHNPFKLFDKKGNFIRAIGAYGQGAGEYLNVYHATLDEKDNRIYLLPWQSEQILVYDLQGNQQPSIPICLRAPKGVFTVNSADSTIAIVLLPFEGLSAVAWTQDFHGNRKQFIAPEHLTAPQDFSNEVITGNNTTQFDVNILCIIPTRVDSLYNYDYKNNRLRPCFTLKFMEDPIPWHGYQELPNHYIGDASYPEQTSATTFESSALAFYIIDKKTVKGAFMRLINDYLGNAEEEYPSFSNGYFVRNIDPGNFKNHLEKALKNPEMEEGTRTRLTNLKNSIKENDNNYILYARIKE